eukprot:6756664-Lingulodinium_polyedra.AAC.1
MLRNVVRGAWRAVFCSRLSCGSRSLWPRTPGSCERAPLWPDVRDQRLSRLGNFGRREFPRVADFVGIHV